MDGPTQVPDVATLAVDDYGGAPPAKRVWGRLVSLNPDYPNLDLSDAEVVIGRQKGVCTYAIEYQYISQQHCKLVREDGDIKGGGIVFLHDLSANGTFVNGEKVGKGNKLLLQTGLEITLLQAKSTAKPRIPKISYLYQYCEDKSIDDLGNGPGKHYEILKVLGSGNFATVKLCVHKETAQKYALKIIDKKKYAMNSSSRKNALMDEVNILTKVKHPNIIGIREVFDTDKSLYIVLELVTGGELFDRIVALGRFPEDRCRGVFRQIAGAVEYLHAQGIAHRDLKPENILMKSKDTDEVKISDFGLSRIIGEGSFAKTMCGTPQYLAPEILTDATKAGYGLECDLWSMGVILYVMLSGTQPFDDSKPVSIFDQIKKAQYSFDGPVWDGISQAAKHLISWLLVVNPTERYTAQKLMKHSWVTGAKFDDSTPLYSQQKDDEMAMVSLEKHLEKKQMTDSGEKRRKPDSASPEPTKKKANVVVEEEDDSFIRTNSADSEFIKSKGSSPMSASNSSSGSGSSSVSAKAKSTKESKGTDNRPLCKYDTACYRKNPDHFKEFRHTNRDD